MPSSQRGLSGKAELEYTPFSDSTVPAMQSCPLCQVTEGMEGELPAFTLLPPQTQK